MEPRRVKRAGIIVALVVGLIVGALFMGVARVSTLFDRGPDAQTIASASLQSVREQARLTPFVPRFVTVVTLPETRPGLQAPTTLLTPGTGNNDASTPPTG